MKKKERKKKKIKGKKEAGPLAWTARGVQDFCIYFSEKIQTNMQVMGNVAS